MPGDDMKNVKGGVTMLYFEGMLRVGDKIEVHSVLSIGVSGLEDPLVNENSVEKCSETLSEAARTPLSDTHSDDELLKAL